MEDFDLKSKSKSDSKAIDFNVFLQDGVIIELEIKRWRGKNKLDESELGLQQGVNTDYNNFMTKYVTLGSKNLFPKDILEKISSVEVRTRKNLKEYSYESPWGRFVPLTAYDKWKENNERLEEEFFEIRDEIARDYDIIVETVKNDYRPLVGTVYKRINGLPIDQAVAVPKEFVRDFLQGILDQIPSPEEIKESFIFEVNLSSLPDLVTGMDAAPPTAYNSPSEKPLQSKKQEQAPIPDTSRIIDMLPADSMTGSVLTPAEKVEKKKVIQDDINKSILGQNNEKLEIFINNVLSQIRELSIDASTDILTSIEKNDGKMVGRASIRAKNLISKVRAMDFYGDAKLKSYIDELETLLDEKPKKRSIEKIKNQIQQIKTYSETSLDTMNSNASVKRVSRRQKAVVPASADGSMSGGVKASQKREKRMAKKTEGLHTEDIPTPRDTVIIPEDNEKK